MGCSSLQYVALIFGYSTFRVRPVPRPYQVVDDSVHLLLQLLTVLEVIADQNSIHQLLSEEFKNVRRQVVTKILLVSVNCISAHFEELIAHRFHCHLFVIS